MKRMIPAMMMAVLCLGALTAAAETPADATVRTLKDRGVMPFVDKAAGFVNLVVRQDVSRIEKAYGMNDQIHEMVAAPEFTEVLKSVDVTMPFEMDLIAFDIMDTQTCSMLFLIHGTNGPIAIKVYMQPSKGNIVHRVEVILDWEEIEKLAHRMEKLPIGYSVTANKLQEDRP